MKTNIQFDIRRRHRPAVNLTAFMDIAFILVIFIVLAANFHRIENLEVNLPDAQGSKVARREVLKIILPKNGSIDIGGQKVSVSEAYSVLEKYIGKFEKVLLLTDRDTPVERAVRILADANRVGFKSVGIAVRGGK